MRVRSGGLESTAHAYDDVPFTIGLREGAGASGLASLLNAICVGMGRDPTSRRRARIGNRCHKTLIECLE
jgi:hypothetical protein